MSKKLAAVVCAVVLGSLVMSCTKGDTGPGGPAGSDGGYVVSFQEGVQPYASYAGVADTRIANGVYLNGNLGAGQDLYTGSANTALKLRFLVKFDLSGVVPATATVSKAYLTVYAGTSRIGNFNIAAYRMTSQWDEGTKTVYTDPADGATWVSRTASAMWTTQGGDYAASAVSDSPVFPANTGDAVTLSLDAAMVTSWLNSPSTNYGVILIGSQESDTSTDNYSAILTSEYTTNLLQRPKLTVYLKP